MDAMGLFGGAPAKSRNVPSFTNLFDSLENLARPVASKIAAKAQSTLKGNPTQKTAQLPSDASKQVAAAMIRSMLGSIPAASVTTPETSLDAKPDTAQQRNRNSSNQPIAIAAQPDSDQDQESITQFEPASGNALIRAMLGTQPGAASMVAPASIEPETSPAETLAANAPALQTIATLAAPEPMEHTPAQPVAERPAQKISRPANINPNPSSMTVAAPSRPVVASPSFVAPAPVSPTLTTPIAAVQAKAEPAAPQISASPDREAAPVEPSSSNANAPAPVAFAARLTPLIETDDDATAPSPKVAPEQNATDAQPANFEPLSTPVKTSNSNDNTSSDHQPQQETPRESRQAPAAIASATQGQPAVRFTDAVNTPAMSFAPATIANAPQSQIETAPARETEIAQPSQIIEPAAAPLTPSTQPVQEIAVRIAHAEMPAVDLHITERGGEIHVAVRTSDIELQSSLRQDLGALTNSLERAGYHAETFVPRAASASQMNLREERQQQQGFSGRGGSQADSGNQKQKGQREQRHQSWLFELENSK
jgi:Flagellar hook-length control protein FliK